MSPTSTSKIRTRILLLSDTHAQSLHAPDSPHPFRHPLPSADLLLHAGDLTNFSTYNDHLQAFNLIASVPCPLKLVIAGNHDMSLDHSYWTSCSQPNNMGSSPANILVEVFSNDAQKRHEEARKVRQLWLGPEAVGKGIRYLEEGVHEFVLKNGARIRVYASPYSPEFGGWGFAYPRTEDRFNRGEGGGVPVPDWEGKERVDVVLTHGPPSGVGLDLVWNDEQVGCDSLRRAVESAKPGLCVFGHIHESYGVARMDWDEGVSGVGVVDMDDEGDGEEIKRKEINSVDVAESETEGKVRTASGGRFGVDRPLRWGKETLFVNAAIMNGRFEPHNAPWVVDIDLPAKEDNGYRSLV